MTVLGVGIDLVEVAAFGTQLGLVGSCFAESTFTSSELADAAQRWEAGSPGRDRHLSARFAVKEAFVKAWSSARAGRSPVMDSVHWTDLEVGNDRWGRPSLTLGGETAQLVDQTLGPVAISVSMTHEDTVAGAVVVISQLPGGAAR